jgi:hypothetical protein
VPQEQRTVSRQKLSDDFYVKGLYFTERKAREDRKECPACQGPHGIDSCNKRFEMFEKGEFFFYPVA